MASIPQFYSEYSFSNDFSQFQNPLLIPQQNCIDAAIPTSVTCVPTALLPDNNSVVACGIDGRCRLQDVCDEFGDECNAVHQDFKPVEPAMTQISGIQGKLMLPAMEDNNQKVVRYSVEERKDRILRYLKKRNQRNFNKTIKYACRKSLADRRVRVRGRFARNNTELCEQEMVMRKEDGNSPIDKNLNYCDAVQTKQDEDEWLQESMANLIYLPYVAS
ncbi:hypothetical protein GOBAR_AA05654 [Gossypium barbadense]|uniref:CCT domain-containing protein n=1 Tax=Gossypium barbadense TaxID=3634 RepID=A0A2P5YH91_GOSBA|nr:hypothetical protein GOBAR_AA05654 [Gossypium barbadense]